MNTQKKNIILVLVIGLILSVTYNIYAQDVSSNDVKNEPIQTVNEDTKDTDQSEPSDTALDQVDEDESDASIPEKDEEELESSKEDTEDNEEVKDTSDTEEQENNEDKLNHKQEDESLDLHEEKTAKEKDKTEAETDKLKSESVRVSDWEGFKTAYDNQNVREIIMDKDIFMTKTQENNKGFLDERSESITIDGGGNTLDTLLNYPSSTFILFNLTGQGKENNFTLKNINIKHNKASIFRAANQYSDWSVSLENVSNENSAHKSSMATGNGIKEVLISSGFNWDSAGHLFQVLQANIVFDDSEATISSVQTTFWSKNLDFRKTTAQFTKKNYEGYSLFARINDTVNSSFVKFENSTVEVNNMNESGTTFVIGETKPFSQNVKFIVDGSNLTVNDNTKSGESGDAIISLIGNSSTEKSGLFIKNKSTVNLNSNGGRALGMQITGGGLIEISDPGTHVTFSNRKESTRNEPLIDTYRQFNNNQVIVSNQAELNLLSNKQGSAEVMRIGARNNRIDVKSNGKLNIENAGENTAQNPGGENRNQAVVFTGSDGTHTDSVNVVAVEGPGSVLSIKAKAGAAIDSSLSTLKLKALSESNLIISGNTLSKHQPIIKSNKLDVEIYDAYYYDIMNTRDGGGFLFYASSSANYKSDLVELEVWQHGSDIQEAPDKQWDNVNFAVNGRYLDFLFLSNNIDFNQEKDSFGPDGMKAYTRIRGNNVKVIDSVKLLEKPYDTDRYIYGKASIKLGSTGESRPALPEEVLATVSEYNTDNKPIETYTKLPSNDGYPVYDTKEDKLAGHFRVDLGEGNLATAGHSFEIKEIYLNEELVNEQAASKVTVIDKTPPKPADFKEVYANDQVIKGSSDEHHISAHFEVNGQVVKDESGETVVVKDAQGQWEVRLPKHIKLHVDDVVTVFLQDANKNMNPVEDTTFHDAKFEKASSIVVKEKKKAPQIKGENLFIPRHEFIEESTSTDDLISSMKIMGVDLNHEDISYEIGEIVVKNVGDETALDFKNPKVGMYDVTAQLKDYPEIQTLKRLYISPYDNVREEQDFVIEANNFSIPDYIAANISQKEVLKRSKAKAWEIKNMHTEQEEIKKHDVEMASFNVKGIPGKYKETLKVIKK